MLSSVLSCVMFVCDFVRLRSVMNKVLESARGDSVWFVFHFGIWFGVLFGLTTVLSFV